MSKKSPDETGSPSRVWQATKFAAKASRVVLITLGGFTAVAWASAVAPAVQEWRNERRRVA